MDFVRYSEYKRNNMRFFLLLLSLMIIGCTPLIEATDCNRYTQSEISQMESVASYAEEGDYISEIKRNNPVPPDTTLYRGSTTLVIYRWNCYGKIEYHFDIYDELQDLYTENVKFI